MSQVPIAAPRRNSEQKRLFEAFQRFSSNSVSDRQIELARACIKTANHYLLIPFQHIIDLNKDTQNYLPMMTSVFDSLFKYVTNLLKPKRPSAWRSIKTNIPWFESRVDCIKGAREVLRIAGYTVETAEAMEFPPGVNEPDKSKLCMLAAELLMAKLEAEQMSKEPGQSPASFRRGDTALMYTGASTGDYSMNSATSMRSGQFDSQTSRATGVNPQSFRAGGGGNAQPLRAGGGYSQPSSIRTEGGNEQPSLSRVGDYSRANQVPVMESEKQPLRAGGVNDQSPMRAGDLPLRAGGVNQLPPGDQPLRAGGVNRPPPLRAGGVNQPPPIRAGDQPNSQHGAERVSSQALEGPGNFQRTDRNGLSRDFDDSSRYKECPEPDTRQKFQPPVPKPRKNKTQYVCSPVVSPTSSSLASSPLEKPSCGSVASPPPRQLNQPPPSDHQPPRAHLSQLSESHADVTPEGSQGRSPSAYKKKLQELRDLRNKAVSSVHVSEAVQSETSKSRKIRSMDHGATDTSTNISLSSSSPEISTTSWAASLSDKHANQSQAILYPPDRVSHPTFSNDTILEVEETETSKLREVQQVPPVPARSSSQLCVNENCSTRLPQGTKFCTDCGTEQVIVKERPCFKCSRRLSVGHKFCFNCGANQSEAPHEGKEEEKKKKHCCFKCSSKLLEGSEFCSQCGANQSEVPPPARPPKSHEGVISAPPKPVPAAPMRASVKDTSALELSHRTKRQELTSGDSCGFSPVVKDQSSPSDHNSSLAGLDQIREKEEALRRHQQAKKAEASSSAVAGPGEAGRYSHEHKEVEASTSSPTQHRKRGNMTGMDYLRMKEEAYKESQRKKGVKEEDLLRLPELVEAEQKEWEEQRQSEQQRQDPTSAQRVSTADDVKKKHLRDLKQFASVNMLQNDYVVENSEADRMVQLEKNGKSLLQSIKVCTPYGYTIGEIHIAFKACKQSDESVLHYLDTEWANKTRTTCQQVKDRRNQNGCSVGMPKETEAREALVESSGEVEVAVDKMVKQREEKVNTLLSKFRYMREVEPSLPELKWDAAVQALSRNGMDVDETCYVLQSEWLQPLYEFIYSEYKKVAKTDMEEIKSIIRNEQQYSLEARYRLLMAEYKFKEKFRAEMVLSLLQEVEGNYPLNYYVDAAKDFDDLKAASSFLNKECPICGDTIPIHEMITMPGCTDSICKLCFKEHFRITIKEKEIKHFNCPICRLPNMMDREATDGIYMTLFVAMIKEHLDPDLYRLCTQKLTDFKLIQMPGFTWCANAECTSGFIYDAAVPRIPREVDCPNCHKSMCLMCKKPWEEQHEGNSCEKFAQWKQENDPDAQKQGLAAHLNASGIECPQCHMRYELARGGCIHFKCTRCPNEFCSGCDQPFKDGQQCGKLESCKKKGLHAHHPRDCLYYMRDFDVKELQDFLREKGVEDFDVDPPKEQVKAAKKKMKQERREAAGNAEGDDEEDGDDIPDAEVKLSCSVMLQKELPEGLADEECGGQVENGHAGLCVVHYKEYLVDKINRNKLDPITMYPVQKIKAMLLREEMPIPPRDDNDVEDGEDLGEETEEELKERLIKHVVSKLPLKAGFAVVPEQAEAVPLAAPADMAAIQPAPAAQNLIVEDVEGNMH